MGRLGRSDFPRREGQQQLVPDGQGIRLSHLQNATVLAESSAWPMGPARSQGELIRSRFSLDLLMVWLGYPRTQRRGLREDRCYRVRPSVPFARVRAHESARYCMGGSMVTNLLSLPSAPITCGVLCHPGPDTKWWGSITKPTLWHLASHDMRFKDPSIGLLRQTFEAKQKEGVEFDCVIHSGTLTLDHRKEGLKRSHRDDSWFCGATKSEA